MKLKHLTIFFLTFAILSYIVFMVIQSDLKIETEKAKIVEAEQAMIAEKMAEVKKFAEARKAKAIEAERIAKAKEADKQTLFYELFLDITYSGYGLDHNMDIPKAILKLENLIAQGANPNNSFEPYSEGDGENFITPIFYTLRTCNNDFRTYGADDRNFYLEILKLLIDSGVDWNVKNYYESEDGESGETTMADSLRWAEGSTHKPECLEALAYVQSHLKENNITLE